MTASLTQPLPNDRCPLCGGPNACAPAQTGTFDTPCWCTHTRIPASLLARIAQPMRGTACVCNACVNAALAEEARRPA